MAIYYIYSLPGRFGGVSSSSFRLRGSTFRLRLLAGSGVNSALIRLINLPTSDASASSFPRRLDDLRGAWPADEDERLEDDALGAAAFGRFWAGFVLPGGLPGGLGFFVSGGRQSWGEPPGCCGPFCGSPHGAPAPSCLGLPGGLIGMQSGSVLGLAISQLGAGA